MPVVSTLRGTTGIVVADASVVINLNATGCAARILAAVPNPVVIVDIVQAELEEGQRRQRQDAALLRSLISDGVVEVVKLSDRALVTFGELVVGPAAETLDDGEAATLAFANENHAIVLVDERKATRICSARFPQVPLGSTVDVFLHDSVSLALGEAGLAEAIFNALRDGRMSVQTHHLEWVLNYIGRERAALCASLPRSARLSSGTAA